MMPLLLLMSLLVLLLVLALLWRRQRTKIREAAQSRPDPLDTVEAWHPKPRRVLTASERRAQALLREACPDHLVLAQVPLSRFLRVPTDNAYADWLQRVGHHCVDLLLCTPDTDVLAVIELQSPESQTSASRQQRIARVRRVLEGAGIAVHILPTKRLPSAATLRLMLLGNSAPAAFDEAPAQSQKRDGSLLIGRTGSRDSQTQDDNSDQSEPTPSTWFDDLETTPLPTLHEVSPPPTPPSR